MGNKFTQTLFTENIKKIQTQQGSRKNYERSEQGEDYHHLLTENEIEFIQSRDSFYMSTIGSNDWPYIQHRGGEKGFVRVLNQKQIVFPDYRGNKQYISVGNLTGNDKIALFFMDYPSRTRLKMIGTTKIVDPKSDAELFNSFSFNENSNRIERAFLIDVVGYDWNCPQFITPRWTEAEIKQAVLPLQKKITELEEELKKYKKQDQT